MFKQLAVAAAAALSLASAFAGNGMVNGANAVGNGSEATPYLLGTLTGSPTVLFTQLTATPGASFEEYANFTIAAPSQVGGSANTYTLNFFGINVMEISNLQIEVWDGSHPNGSMLFSAFAGNNATNAFTLGAGNYHLDISGTFGPNAVGGQYSVAMNAMPVPEPETYALMLAGLGAVAFMARRRRVV
jgi:hypothetical protein